MIDLAILKRLGSTTESFRELFTAQPGSKLHDLRKKWEERIESRIQEGVVFNLANYQFYASADLAWDSNLITKTLVPLQAYAQGKITFSALKEQVKDLSAETRAQFLQYDDKGEATGINIPEFHKVVVNLVRSFITRRTAVLATRYTKLQPMFKFEPLSTSFVAKLRGDVLSQRVEMIANAYGYRHDLVQAIRSMLLYGFTVEFAATAWEKDTQLRRRKRVSELDSSNDDSFETEAFVVREGVLFERPHPTRVFWDNAYPLASVNTDTGVNYLGYWAVRRFGDMSKNPVYFNRDEVVFDQGFTSQLAQHRGFWELYSSGAPINFPTSTGTTDIPGLNDREKQIGVYTPERNDQSVLLTEYRERVIPKEVGLGDYPYPVWVRLVVAGGRTVVYGEFLPSAPAVYFGYNSDDSRLVNNSFAHDIIPWTDLLSNALSNLLVTQRSALIKLIMLDIDLVNDPKVLEEVRKIARGESIYTKPHLIEFKGSQLATMDEKPREALQVAETNPINDITQYYKSLMMLLSLAERVLGISSNESAQSEPREISATESSNIAATTNTSVAFMGIGVDEAIDAKKRLLYEALIAMGETRVQTPAANRYMKSTITAAGFKLLDEGLDGTSESMFVDKGSTIVGTKEQLVYDWNFSSRDGSERASNAKAAEVLVNLLAQLTQFPGFAEALGRERLYALLNEVVVLSGAGVDLRFDLQDGESPEMPQDPSAAAAAQQGETKQATEEALHQVVDAITADRQKIAQLQQMVQQMVQQPAAPVAPPPTSVPRFKVERGPDGKMSGVVLAG